MASQLDSLIEQLGQTTKAIQDDPAFFQSLPEQRLKLLKATQELYKTTQQAMEACMEFLIGMAQVTVIRLFIKWKVFEAIADHGPISFSSLAEKAGADVTLISTCQVFAHPKYEVWELTTLRSSPGPDARVHSHSEAERGRRAVSRPVCEYLRR